MEEIGLIFGVPVRSPKLLGIGKYAAAPDRYSLLLSMKSRLSSVFGYCLTIKPFYHFDPDRVRLFDWRLFHR